MALRRLARCSTLFVIVFLMCPKRHRFSAPISKKKDYVHVMRRSPNDVNNVDNIKILPGQWSTNIIRRSGDEDILSVDTEPGFDLSDEEIKKFKIWPKGIIPYYIDVPSFNDKVLRDRIRLFLNLVNTVSKLSFQELPSPPKDDKTRWVFFANRRGQLGCGDHSLLNFTNDGVQHVLLGYECLSMGGELTEAVLAIAGVPPQHNAPDRDDFLNIKYENIIPEKKYLFTKLTNDQWLFHNLDYDFSSGGHYNYHKYSANGRATIETKPDYSGVSLGESNGFTITDVIKLRMLYNYILKKKDDTVPECGKLFKKGKNFDKMLPDPEKPKPRKKPNLYLGLPEGQDDTLEKADSSEAAHKSDEKSDEEHEEKSDEKHEGKSDEKHEEKSDGHHDEKNYETGDVITNGNYERGSEEPTASKSNFKARNLKLKQKIHDPLSHLSDYLSDDRRKFRYGKKYYRGIN